MSSVSHAQSSRLNQGKLLICACTFGAFYWLVALVISVDVFLPFYGASPFTGVGQAFSGLALQSLCSSCRGPKPYHALAVSYVFHLRRSRVGVLLHR